MDANLGNFKHIFILDSIYGLTTVSLDTMEQVKLKIAYSGLLIGVYVLELIMFLYDEITHLDATQIMRCIITLFPLYCLITAVLDYKSKISAAMTLEEIESKVESKYGTLSGRFWFKVIVMGVLAINIVLQTIILGSNILLPQIELPVTRYVTSIQFFGTTLMQGLSMILLLSKVVTVQGDITNSFSKIHLDQMEYVSSRGRRPRNQRRRATRIRTEYDKKWNVLVELQGALNVTENTIREYYLYSVIWYRIIVEAVGPFLIVLWCEDQQFILTWMYYLQNVILFLNIVYVVNKIENEKSDALWNFVKEKGAERDICPKRVKHQLLAKIHRKQAFSCTFFNVESSLVATVFENSMLAITTVIALYRRGA